MLQITKDIVGEWQRWMKKFIGGDVCEASKDIYEAGLKYILIELEKKGCTLTISSLADIIEEKLKEKKLGPKYLSHSPFCRLPVFDLH